MSNAPNTIPVVIEGDSTSLMSALGKATEGIRNFTKDGSQSLMGMSNPLSGLVHTFDQLKGVSLGAMTAIAGVAIAIGTLYKVGDSAVSTTVDFGKEVLQLHKFMGGTSQQAGELAMALHRVGIPAEQFIGYMTKEMKSVDKVIEKHKELRSVLLNQDGTYKSMGDINQALIDKYLSFADAGDRARFAILAWGKSGPEAIAAMQKIAKAQEENRAVLGDLKIDYKDIEDKTKDYIKAQRDLKVIHEAQSVQIGSALLPIWTNFQTLMGKMASDEMPAMVNIFKTFASAILIALGAIRINFEIVKMVVEGLANIVVPIIEAAYEALQGNYSEAKEVLKRGANLFVSDIKDSSEKIKKTYKDTADAVQQIWNPVKSGAEVTVETKAVGTPDKDKDSALEAVKKRLEAAKAAYEMEGIYELDVKTNTLVRKKEEDQQFREFSKEMEIKFLDEEIKNFAGTEKDKQKLITMRLAAERDVLKQLWASKLQALDNEIKAQTFSDAKAIELAKKKAADILALHNYDKNHADYQKALESIHELEKKAADRSKEVALIKNETLLDSLLAEKDAEIKAINHNIDMGNISEIAGLKKIQAIEDKKYEIQREALLKRMALKKLDGDAGAKEVAKMEGELSKLNTQAAARRIDTENKTNAIIKAGWTSLFSSIKGEMNKSIQGLILGTTNLSGALKGIWASMKASFAQMAADQLMIWIGLEKSKTAASGESALQIFAIETWASLKKVGLWIWEGLKYIAIQAWRAAAGAYQAIVGIPVVGPFLAPAAAAVALGAVMKMVASIASARKGFDIKAGENPITQLHEKEMVLPADHADTIRSLKGNNFSEAAAAIVASNNQMYKNIARSQASVDKYNSKSSIKSPSGNRSNGANITVNGFVGSERQLAQQLNTILNKDARIYGSAR